VIKALSCQLGAEVIFWPLRFQGDAWLMAAVNFPRNNGLKSRDVSMRRDVREKMQTGKWRQETKQAPGCVSTCKGSAYKTGNGRGRLQGEESSAQLTLSIDSAS
jgi:hypothetical protein